MKTKGITFWEEHLEHFVLGLAALVFIALTAMQFMGDPNAVVVGKDKIAPGKVDQMLEDRATQIRSKISDDAPPPMPVPDPSPVLVKFNAQRTASVSPQKTMFVANTRITPVGGYVDPPSEGSFMVANIAAPHDMMAQQYFDTLSEETMTAFPELRKVVPVAPYDIVWTTAAAKFNIGAILKQFSQRGPNGEAPLPVKWYNDHVDCIDVKIEREEMQPDGTFGNLTLIAPIPGQASFREQIASRVDATMRDEILGFLADAGGRDQIIQPEFYDTVASQWTPPGEVKTVAAANPNIEDSVVADLKSKLEKLKKERERITKQMKDRHCSENPPPEPPKTGSGTDTSGGGGRGRGGGGAAPPGAGVGTDSGRTGGLKTGGVGGEDSSCDSLRKKRKKIDEKIAKIEAELAKLDVTHNVETTQPAAPVVEEAKPLPDEIMIWGHDITVQPGKTYRYRFTVEIYNPMFAHKLDLMPPQQPLAEQFTLKSQTSEWSAPIAVEPPLRLFITKANPGGGTQTGPLASAAGNALAEVYRFYDGHWWMEKFTVFPGDRIGSAKTIKVGEGKDAKPGASIDYGTEWFVLDVVEDPGASDNDTKNGLGAMVLLQNINSEGQTQNRSPRDDTTSAERQRLKEEAAFSRVGNAVVAAK